MGEIAEMMLEGILDEKTGEYIGEPVGYPRTLQPRFYNSIKKRKLKRNIKHVMKCESLGGLHLVGRRVTIEGVGECEIVDYTGKKGRKRYIVVDKNGQEHRVKFSRMILCVDK